MSISHWVWLSVLMAGGIYTTWTATHHKEPIVRYLSGFVAVICFINAVFVVMGVLR